MNDLTLRAAHRRQAILLIVIRLAFSISIALLSHGLAFAQDVANARSFLFVTINTREHMTHEAAWPSLDSFEQRNFLAVEKHFGARLCSTAQVMNAEGMDGATVENSTAVIGCESSRVDYLGELLGRYAHQKWILIFKPSTGGNERLLIVTFNTEHPEDTAKLLRQQGIIAATIEPETKMVRVYVWVRDHSQDAGLDAFVQAVHGTLQQLAGTGTTIGNDSRFAAQQVFDNGIRAYERAHHQSFSKLLWSRRLHDLGLRGSR